MKLACGTAEQCETCPLDVIGAPGQLKHAPTIAAEMLSRLSPYTLRQMPDHELESRIIAVGLNVLPDEQEVVRPVSKASAAIIYTVISGRCGPIEF